MSKSDSDEIRIAAYYLWQKAGSPEGRAEEFWFQAKNLNAKLKTPTKKRGAKIN